MSRKPSLPKDLCDSIRARGKGNYKGNDWIAAGNALSSALNGALAMTAGRRRRLNALPEAPRNDGEGGGRSMTAGVRGGRPS
jgi:hypothetical protein